MTIKSLAVFPILTLAFGLSHYFFAPLALAENDSFGTSTWREYRNHCVWKKGKFGMKYRSCAAQYRACKKFTGNNGTSSTPQQCGDWINRT